MNKAEVAKLLAFVTAVYPNINIKNGTVEAWHEMLKDLPFNVALAATKKVIGEQEIPCVPAIGKIRAAATQLTTPQLPTSGEAWGEVKEAIRKYGFYRELEAMENLSPPVKQVVKWMGWREICMSEEPDIVRAQFRKAYESQCSREKEMSQMPADVRQLISNVVKALPSAD